MFTAVENGRAAKGIIPVENSVGGAVNLVLDALHNHSTGIEAEGVIPVKHCLMALGGLAVGEIKTLYVHEQAYAQCEDYIGVNLPTAELSDTTSNAMSAKLAASDTEGAAIGPRIAAEIYGLNILGDGVQDKENNASRFFLLSNAATQPTGNDKTSIMVYPPDDHPGLLHDILGVIKGYGFNLTRNESIPRGNGLGRYFFSIDFTGHVAESDVAEAINIIRQDSVVRILGSYARKY